MTTTQNRDYEIEQLKRDFMSAWAAAAHGRALLGPKSLHVCAIRAQMLGVRQGEIREWHREWKATSR